MKLVGLTGGIGSGKSTIAARLAKHGAVVVDADVLARKAVERGTVAHARIVECFGAGVLRPDGELDRGALAAIVFTDAAKRQVLNDIVHPEVRRLSLQAFAAIQAETPSAIVVYDVPLLAETRVREDFDHIVVAVAPTDVRVKRLMEARGLSEPHIRARMAAQASDDSRAEIADTIIDTSGSVEATFEQVDRLWHTLATAVTPEQ